MAVTERRPLRIGVAGSVYRRCRVLWAFAQRAGQGSSDDQVVKHLIVPRSGQYVFKDIVQHYLKQINFDKDKYAKMIRLPQYGTANVVLDPYRGYGQPVFDSSGARVTDALGPLRAGESFKAVAEDYGVSERDLRVVSGHVIPQF